ncbi:hypothetical protein ACQKP8_14895 [Photobacterium alginatilyticum]|uniref:hypothetical protein n=1 Tax=Photobacterium alginatilyticum TaxID=1775171 RepID=UPI0040676B24
MNLVIKNLIVICILLLINACSSTNNYTYRTPSILTPISHSNIHDARREFYEVFCSFVEGNCDEYLFYNDIKVTSNLMPKLVGTDKLRVVIIPGIFGECLGDEVQPFMFSAPYIEQRYPWVTVEIISNLNGRASSVFNSMVINNYLKKLHPDPNEEIVLISYSKGTTDALYYLEKYYDGSPRITSLVSISGVVTGTPIADLLGEPADNLVKSIPLTECPSADNSGIPSLTLNKQMQWLTQSQRAFNHDINMFSIVSLSTNENTSSIFKKFHEYLDGELGANDGQVAGVSQVLPGSSILGYFNADHWALVLPFEHVSDSKLSTTNRLVKSVADENSFPRAALLESIIIFIDNYEKQDFLLQGVYR